MTHFPVDITTGKVKYEARVALGKFVKGELQFGAIRKMLEIYLRGVGFGERPKDTIETNAFNCTVDLFISEYFNYLCFGGRKSEFYRSLHKTDDSIIQTVNKLLGTFSGVQ